MTNIEKAVLHMDKDEAILHLQDIARGKDNKAADRMKAIEVISRLKGWEDTVKLSHDGVSFNFSINIGQRGGDRNMLIETGREKCIEGVVLADENTKLGGTVDLGVSLEDPFPEKRKDKRFTDRESNKTL